MSLPSPITDHESIKAIIAQGLVAKPVLETAIQLVDQYTASLDHHAAQKLGRDRFYPNEFSFTFACTRGPMMPTERRFGEKGARVDPETVYDDSVFPAKDKFVFLPNTLTIPEIRFLKSLMIAHKISTVLATVVDDIVNVGEIDASKAADDSISTTTAFVQLARKAREDQFALKYMIGKIDPLLSSPDSCTIPDSKVKFADPADRATLETAGPQVQGALAAASDAASAWVALVDPLLTELVEAGGKELYGVAPAKLYLVSQRDDKDDAAAREHARQRANPYFCAHMRDIID